MPDIRSYLRLDLLYGTWNIFSTSHMISYVTHKLFYVKCIWRVWCTALPLWLLYHYIVSRISSCCFWHHSSSYPNKARVNWIWKLLCSQYNMEILMYWNFLWLRNDWSYAEYKRNVILHHQILSKSFLKINTVACFWEEKKYRRTLNITSAIRYWKVEILPNLREKNVAHLQTQLLCSV